MLHYDFYLNEGKIENDEKLAPHNAVAYGYKYTLCGAFWLG